jgi:hypothetical protein
MIDKENLLKLIKMMKTQKLNLREASTLKGEKIINWLKQWRDLLIIRVVR